MNTGGFNGFTEETIEFFKELKVNNNKEWFTENKNQYEKYVKKPAKSFVADMGVLFADKGLPFAANIKKAIFRINRDIRFSKDKSPYKTHLGIFFPYTISESDKKPVNSLGLYFHFEPDMYFIAGGLHSPEPDRLKALRLRLDHDYKSFGNIVNDRGFLEIFPEGLQGEQLKTAPKGFDTEHPGIEYLRYKQFFATHPVKKEDTFSPVLNEEIIKCGVTLMPMLDYLNETAMIR